MHAFERRNLKRGFVISHSSDKWTRPFHGVAHANVDLKSKGIRQITVVSYDKFADVYALPLAGFTAVWEETHKNAQEARRAAEARWF